jgi:predicted  nucleic acid-binding Zn-ribbon protein
VAWYLNHYQCARCDYHWDDEWSCTCDDGCPQCGARHMSPYDSDDLTITIEACADEFVVLRSPKTAEHSPDYYELGRFPTREKAQGFLGDLARAWG